MGPEFANTGCGLGRNLSPFAPSEMAVRALTLNFCHRLKANMNRKQLACIVILAALSSGCTIPEMLVGAFGEHYTGGGLTSKEKKSHVQQQVRNAERFNSYGPFESVSSPWNDGF